MALTFAVLCYTDNRLCCVCYIFMCFAFNAAKGSAHGNLEGVKALRELMQLKDSKENFGNMAQLMNNSSILS